MRTLTPRDKRALLYGGLAIGLYLMLFGGYRLGGAVETRLVAYHELVARARSLRQELKPYDERVLVVKKMMDHYQLDPAKLSRATVVGEASAELQKTALASGVVVGAVRESPMKASAKELATLQFEGSGPVPAVLGLLKHLETLGFPLLIDSVQITPSPMPSGPVKLILTVVVLDFDQWKTEDKPHA